MAAPSAQTRRPLLLALCATVVAALLAVAALAPLPYSVAHPGDTVDVLGTDDDEPVIRVSGQEVREPEGELRVTTIMATSPDTTVRLSDVVSSYVSSERSVMPREAVYPVGDSLEEIQEHNRGQMTDSQHTAVTAALTHLGMAEDEVEIDLRLDDIGGPSAGLLFSLGIIDLLAGDGEGGDLTGGRTVAGTGAIAADGTVGSVGGVPLKIQAAAEDGASVFVVPAAECRDAAAELPDGVDLLPVETLQDALDGLRELNAGGELPSC